MGDQTRDRAGADQPRLNARDAMPNGGELTISTSNVVVSDPHGLHQPAAPGHYVRLEVSDTGEGIPPDVLPKIFEPFFTTKEVGKGTGLGLASIYGIVEDSGGSIFVESEPGKGARFTMYFPRTFEATGEPESDRASS
jgi:two-component system cell cycle sensor histidine kinase/response regulator CckA